jgi:D-alanyl-D-alanine carboxypeptidase
MAIKVFLDQKIPLDKVVTYKKQDELYNYKYCQPVESASLKVKDGETMKVSDLLYAALVGSANNAVESLVRVSGLTRVQFINKMNEVAKSLGALNTNFVEPTGLSPENVSTAEDYAIIAKEASKNSLIEKISATPKYTFKTINTKKVHTLYNTNDFLRDGLFAAYNDLTISGSKTGYLNEAGYNLMTRAQGLNGEKVLAIVMGAVTKNQATEEIKELLRYGIRQIDNLNDKIK